MFMVTFLVVAVAVAILGEETRGRGLEELAGGAQGGDLAEGHRPVAGPAD